MKENNKILKKVISNCQSGGKKVDERIINEDLVKIGNGYAILMDGATGLGGPKTINGLTPAEWYVQLVANFLEKELLNKEKDIKTIVSEAIDYITAKIRKYETDNNMKFDSFAEPSAGIIIYREISKMGKNYIQVFELGDCSAIISYKDGTIKEVDNPNGEKLRDLDSGVLNQMVKIAYNDNVNVIDARNYPEIQSMLEVNRSKKNTPEGYWILGTSKEAIEHGVFLEEQMDKVKQVILHSDGFNYQILGLSIAEVFEECKTEQSLENLQRRIRQAEENDKNANKQARFKQSDDMSIAIIDSAPIIEKNVETIDKLK